MTDATGIVWWSFWEPTTTGNGWQFWSAISPEQKAAPGAKITAQWAAYDANHLDIFMTSSDGSVYSTYSTDDSTWKNWSSIFPNQKLAPGATVTAIWAPDTQWRLDIFATGADGTVWRSYWTNTVAWTPFVSIEAGQKLHPKAEVSVVWTSQFPYVQDLFATGSDGTVYNAQWNKLRGWKAWEPVHEEQKVAPGAKVTALLAKYDAAHLDLFATDSHGAVWSTYRTNGPFANWASLSGSSHFAAGTTVSAIWAPYTPAHLDLFLTGNDGTVWTSFWDIATGWKDIWYPINPQQKGQIGSEVTPVWSAATSNHVDLFMCGKDGLFLSNWWESSSDWSAWFHIAGAYPWKRGPLLKPDPAQVAIGDGGGGRWYPTCITLRDGSVFMLAGHPLIWQYTGQPGKQLQSTVDVRHSNTTPEILDPSGTSIILIAKSLGQNGAHDFCPFYPRIFLMPHTGNLFIAQPLYGSQVVMQLPGVATTGVTTTNPTDVSPDYTSNVMNNSIYYDIEKQDVVHSFQGPQFFDTLYLVPDFTSQPTTAVLLPLLHEENYKPRVLLAGAVWALIADLEIGPGITNAWQHTAPRNLRLSPNSVPVTVRHFCNGTLLPTGDVAITGGVAITDFTYTEHQGVKSVEIYHPPLLGQPDSWTTHAAANETRGYHSTALLMPDGRIWTGGSEDEDVTTPQYPAGVPKLAMEIYEPPYYGLPNRLQITQAPSRISYGTSFNVSYIAPIKSVAVGRVALMRFGSATHSFDGDQRYVGVPFLQIEVDPLLLVTAPPDGTVAPPGYYMLWLVDANGLPCEKSAVLHLGG
jgi:hypothetical protein